MSFAQYDLFKYKLYYKISLGYQRLFKSKQPNTYDPLDL